MSNINVTHIDLLDISQMTNTQVTVSGSSMTLTPLPSDGSDYERGMRKAMQKIAVSCGRVFGVDVGYEDLPDLVDSILRSKKESAKPKPTKFVKVEESIFDLKEEFDGGELYVSTCEGHYTQILGEKGLFLAAFNNSIYRQVEIDWRESVVSIAPRGYGVSALGEVDIRIDGAYNKEQVLILANAIIESLTDKPE